MTFDVIVIGGGHAGIEAAHSASKRVRSVLLVTSHLDLIGQMSCNPAIGGIAKGNIVREIDALGGVMAKAIDIAGIHFKMLNQSKGMAVWGPRAQADKKQYRSAVLKILESQKNISFLQANVVGLLEKNGCVAGVLLENSEKITAAAVVLAMGTFLNGVGHIGLTSFSCGRSGEPPMLKLTEALNGLGIQSGRLKTGTSPRIDGRTIDFSKMREQPGDERPEPFSFTNVGGVLNQASCWETKTTCETHSIIRENLHRSPLFSGKIKSIGPRYCPSIEDKVMRFGERGGHTLFLEPEALTASEMYLNGLSTSLPFDVQQKMVVSVPGLENARIIRPGYAIEYDYFQPLQLRHTLESKSIKNLFFAGQINGTSGYEEAAGQGVVAGINAALQVSEEEPICLGRETSYIGVLIDDLVTRGTEEPYRMFTSRAEYRLLLRQDNADERLMPLAHRRGFLSTETLNIRERIWDKKREIRIELQNRRVPVGSVARGSNETPLRHSCCAEEYLRRPGVSMVDIENLTGAVDTAAGIKRSVEADIKYQGFVEKQTREIEQHRRMETAIIPAGILYADVSGLLTEARIKLEKIRPETLGQASRIPGVTPADITVLMAHL